MQNIEGLGTFYLGRRHDLAAGETTGEALLYDAKDLTTHAVCVGMTGSGKTGLCVSLLEEAAIDGIPAIAIDPKGDLGNLLLTFPSLAPNDFLPWVEAGEATRQGMSTDEYAQHVAKLWHDGLAKWDEDGARIQRFKDAVDVSIYTPGSSAGLPLTVLRSFQAPPREVIEDSDALRERISSAASGLLALLGIDADPIRSREHILISNIFDTAWRAGKNLDIAGLIREIQKPPFDKVGFLDIESFFPSDDRADLAMSLNNLLASPSFAGWLEGEPLDVQRLLYTPEGKPRLSIISIAHLSETERMFLVTILLNEVLAWVRAQPGTSSLRALLYMDEVFGFFPPTANPPAKKPMLTLLKQARAYGLGVVLATQNPVDLDYKGLSNTGTWFIGRLQTERDKMRVMEGLEGASAAAGSNFNRAEMEATLAGLGKRVFLMNNVHEDEPVVFQTRWALSYLRGPLTRTQIQTLMEPRKAERESVSANGTSMPTMAVAQGASKTETVREAVAKPQAAEEQRPILPPEIKQRYLALSASVAPSLRIVYRPALFGMGKLHFVKSTYDVDHWQDAFLLADTRSEVPDELWESADSLRQEPDWEDDPQTGATFAELPAKLRRKTSYKSWTSKLKTFLYRERELTIYKCAELKEYSHAGESEGDFRVRLRQLAVEARDIELEKLKKKYKTKLEAVQKKIQTAEAAVDREKAQSRDSMISSIVSIGSTVLGAMVGRKMMSKTNIGKAGTAIRSAGRASSQRGDVTRAEEKVEHLREEMDERNAEFEEELEKIKEDFQPENLELEELSVTPRKSDIAVEDVALIWCPWIVDSAGIAEPGYVVE